MNEEELIKELKYNIPEDYIRSCDTSDGIGRCEIDTDSWQYQLYVYVLKLQNNWNELKKWCKETIETVECTDLSEDYLMGCEDILKKMQELEKKR